MELDFSRVKADWRPLLQAFFHSAKGVCLAGFLEERRKAGAVIFPSTPFLALELTSLESVRVVIVGQDPYHEMGQAQGLAFSVSDGQKISPSLRNIFKEISREFGTAPRRSGNLTDWARQGVLLINSVLTVEEGKAGSHAGKGWECLTDQIIHAVAARGKPAAFLLWGGYAQKKIDSIRSAGNGHLILCANHPSPLSASRGPLPFIGNEHFSEVNEWLLSVGEEPINWTGKTDTCDQLELYGF